MAWMAYLWMGAAALVGAGMTLWGGYYLVTALMSWRKPMDYGRHPASTRFAILVAARNEELVIGNLINSLLAQDYPRELYDIWVIPNNCTDHTAQAARDFGANVMECTVPLYRPHRPGRPGFRGQCHGVHRPCEVQGRCDALCLPAAAGQGVRRLLCL